MQSYVDDGECRVYESYLEEGKAIGYDCLAHDTSVRFTCFHPENGVQDHSEVQELAVA